MKRKPISAYRRQIDALDRALLALLSRRAAIAREGAEVKQQSGIPVLDAEREQAILERVRSDNPGPLAEASVARIFRCIIEESRRLAADPASS